MENVVVFVIVNAGFSDDVMNAARDAGAFGGTVINARGTAKKEAEKMFNITIQPEKEIVLIIVPTSIKDNVLHNIYQKVGLNTPGHGIAFTMKVDEAVGIGSKPKKAENKEEEKNVS